MSLYFSLAPCTRLNSQLYAGFQVHIKYSSSYCNIANLLLKNKQKYVVVNTDFSIFDHGLQKLQNTFMLLTILSTRHNEVVLM